MSVPARRYAPFVAVVMAQLLLVAVAPSKAPQVVAAAAPLPFDQPAGATGSGPAPGAPDSAAPGTQPGSGPAGSTTTASGATSGGTSTSPGQAVTGSVPGAVGRPAPGAPASGDISHCVNGRQVGPGFTSSPPCVPAFLGTNPGATTRGVTAKTITVIIYRPKENEVVNGFTRSQNLYGSPEEHADFVAKAETFINSKWELYGRTLSIVFIRGTCDYSPPADDCMRTEARALVTQHKPFAFIWENNSAVPSMADELSRLKVVNLMGWHFDDAFSKARRPYHYDQYMGGTTQAGLTGEWWCKRMAGAQKARYAGSDDLRAKIRKVAISHPDAEVNKGPADELARIIKGCGTQVVDAPYSSNTATAASQANTTVARLKAEGVTSVLYFSDPLSPAFTSKAATGQDYYPENVLVGSGLVDYDILARLYDPQQWKNAFGPSDLRDYEPFDKQTAVIAYKGGGGTKVPYAGAQLPWAYLNTLANGLQMAGPNLTPLTYERALLSGAGDYGGDGNSFQYWLHFGPGDYSGISDAREVYWDAGAISRIDGKAGAYVSMNKGRRYKPGEFARTPFVFPGR